jgi:DNA polymerase
MHKDNYGNRYGPLTVDRHSLIMPNGMALKYQDLMSTRQGLMYKTSRGDEFTYGGRITENVIQALSRIIITDSMLRLDKAIPNGKVVLTVHDEVIISAPNDCPDATMQKIFDDLCTPPGWALNLPLDVDGGYDTSYSK